MEASMRIEVDGEERVLKSLYDALYPETTNPPSPECRSDIRLEGKLVVEVYCNRINLLRAVANSYLSIISMIIKSLEVQEDG